MKPNAVGSFALVLHSHIPYVLAHGRWPHGMDWLSEVTAETYIPLLDVCHRLIEEGISPRITLGITPVLAEQLADPEFQFEFKDYLNLKIQAARDNQAQFAREGSMHMLGLAHYWESYYTRIQSQYQNTYAGDLIGAFRKLQDAGHIEILTSAATHGYLPLLMTDESVQAQVKQGVQTYKKHFGRQPRGFWLPECAYRPRYAWSPPGEKYRLEPPKMRKGVEEFLAENGLQYFFVDAHLLKGGEAIGVYADRFAGLQALWAQFAKGYTPEIADRTPYAPYLVNSSGKPGAHVAIFGRDHKTGAQVWSGESGYPGDAYYLEFHKKHYPGNLRYWRVSWPKNDLGNKSLYEPRESQFRAQAHAEHFVGLIHDVLHQHQEENGTPGVITSMYDTELFGHWWFEGPEFLYHMLKRLHADPTIEMTTCGDYLTAQPPQVIVSLPEGSWGEGGYHWIWLNEWTAWTWDKIYEAELVMTQLVQTYGEVSIVQPILKQAAREILLLESSDWQFSISTFSSRDYAEQRINYHFTKFMQLAALIRRAAHNEENSIGDSGEDGETNNGKTNSEERNTESISAAEWNLLGEAEDRDRCFNDVDPQWWRPILTEGMISEEKW